MGQEETWSGKGGHGGGKQRGCHKTREAVHLSRSTPDPHHRLQSVRTSLSKTKQGSPELGQG